MSLSNQQMLSLLVRKGKPPTDHEIRMILVELVGRLVNEDNHVALIDSIEVFPDGCDGYGSLQGEW